jgi:hypothetical protein
MAQIFHRSANYISKYSIVGVALLLGAVGLALTEIQRSPYVTNQGIAHDQPVPFSHQHHVAALGIDCRYCHTSVEVSSFAGIPPTKTCMNCHSQIWTNAPMLEPVRASFRTGQPLVWTRVHDLPDFVKFRHDIHVTKGVGCATCHGPIDQMHYTYQAASLQMEWCMECHREPLKYVRPREEVFNLAYTPPSSAQPVHFNGKQYKTQQELGEALRQAYQIDDPKKIMACSTCHY